MKMRLFKIALCATVLVVTTVSVQAKGDDFGSVVKMIEDFYHVKHEGLPFLAKAGMKAVSTAAKIRGGTAKRIAEAGSMKLAVFEDQSFDSPEFTQFRQNLNATLRESWMPFVQTLSATDKEQTYIFLRNAGEKFHVLLITIEPHDATVIQVTLSPANLALLLKDPEGMGKAISDEATINDQE